MTKRRLEGRQRIAERGLGTDLEIRLDQVSLGQSLGINRPMTP